MPKCGSQCWLCDLPIRFDTYVGCTHDCKYCFVRRKSALNVSMGETVKALVSFMDVTNRNRDCAWCDWDIPVHWGGVSDPFQPCEKEFKRSLSALQLFVKTQYPVIISTKGKLCIEEPYLSLIRQANCVMQVSALCEKYDALEKGAPPFEERLKMIEILSHSAKRVVVRAQPYIHDIFNDMLENIPRFAQAGAYGIIFEGMKFVKRKPGLVKRGGDFCQSKELLRRDFLAFREKCHKNNLHFYSGENCLRSMGDSLTCCGIDGLEGFKPNTFNLNHMLNGDKVQPSKSMNKPGTGNSFRAIYQDSATGELASKCSFAEMMKFTYQNKREYVESVMIGE